MPCVREGVVLPENMNMVLHHLSQGLGWGQAMKNISMQHYMNRHSGSEHARILPRCPASFLGLKPYSVHKAEGCSMLRCLPGSGEYVHHLTLDYSLAMACIILVADSHIVSLIIHLDKDCLSAGMNPVIISSTTPEKLRSLQLAIEYALLLNMPYRVVDNVSFTSLGHGD